MQVCTLGISIVASSIIPGKHSLVSICPISSFLVTIFTMRTAAAFTVMVALASATELNTHTMTLDRRNYNSTTNTTTCAVQPAGLDIHPSPDTPDAFLSYPYFASTALAATPPTGFTQTFSNLNASSVVSGYLGATYMDTYSPQACANLCSNVMGCVAINTYFERKPSLYPDDASCANPNSTTAIVCVFWGGPVDAPTATNYGQWWMQFQKVVAGSNGYVDNRVLAPQGYNEVSALVNVTINPPLDCSGGDTYMGNRLWTTGNFSVSRCAAICTKTSVWDLAHGINQTCQFFATYLLFKNGGLVGQECAMYSKSWGSEYAKNKGYWNGNDHYTVGYSFTYSNITDAGSARGPCIAKRRQSRWL